MKIARLWQPRRAVFWMMVAFNGLSSGFAWAMRAWPLSELGLTIFGFLALSNSLCGLWIAWRLLRGE